MKIELIITADEANVRLDRLIRRNYPNLSQGIIEKSLRKGLIKVNGKKAASNHRLSCDEVISIASVILEQAADLPIKEKDNLVNNKRYSLDDYIIYLDEDIIVINKPAGLAVQGGTNIKVSVDSLLGQLQFDKPDKPKLVHRLDKDTSGILILARNSYSASKLTEFFRLKQVDKIYWALVSGNPPRNEGKIESFIGKEFHQGLEKVTANNQGKKAITLYRVKDFIPGTISWLELKPITGRTHQLRVHCAELGTPILGDKKYGGRNSMIKGVSSKLHLHARKITLPGVRGGECEFIAPLPSHMQESWKYFGYTEKD